jgi:hypothetical protein
MCDYSLHAVNNRLANEGERLMVRKFQTGSKGLASPADLDDLQQIRPAPEGAGIWSQFKHWVKECRRVASPEDVLRALPAVCIPPGARLHLEDIPEEMQKAFAVGEAEEVTFTQITNEPFRYRDAFRFANGIEVLVKKFPEGTPVEVLALRALAEELEEAEPEEKMVSAVNYQQTLGRSMRANA